MNKLLLLLIALAFPVVAQAQTSEPLVTTQWAAENLNNPQVRFAEVSVEPGKFERGHIPGAVNLRWHTDLVDPVRRDIVSPEQFQELLSRHGITNETTVVLYGDHNNWFAAWGAWVFSLYGHENIKILDGGRDKWETERRPVSNRPASYTQTDYRIAAVNSHLRASLQDVLAVVHNEQEGALIDIRSAAEYEGRVIAPEGIQELAIRAGHIPGAVNVP